MATSQQVITTLRNAGISEDIIAKKVKELGGTYTPPVSSKSTLSTGISGPEDLIAKSNLPTPKGTENPIMKFLFNAPMRLGKGLGTLASNLVNPIGYTKDPETQRLQQQAEMMAQSAESRGDVEGARRLREVAGKSQAVNQGIEQERTQSYKTSGEDIIKGGVGTAAYLLPGGIATKYLGKTGGQILSGVTGGGMTGFGASESGQELAGTIGGATIGGVMSGAGQLLNWTGKKFTQKMIQASGSNENKIISKFGKTVNDILPKYGKNVDELLGPISEKNKGGTFKIKLKEAEDIIQGTVDAAGGDVRIDGDDVIKLLKKQLKIEKTGIEDQSIVRGLEKIIKSVQKKYKNGISANQALTILRKANSKYGQAMAKAPKGSTIAIAKMTEAETMRETLKFMFPEIAEALQTQSEILTLRPMVQSARGTAVSSAGQGLFPKGFELQKPLTWPVAGPILEATGEKVLPMALKGAGAVLQSPITQRGLTTSLVSPTEGAPTTVPTETGLETGGLPTPEQTITPEKEEPILSPGGQWQWDATQNDWVPYQAETTQGASLTGYTPEELYTAAIKAYKAGDKSSYSQLINMYDEETKYQDRIVKNKEKLEKSKKGNVGTSIDMMEKLYSPGTPSSLSMGTKTVGLSALTGRADVMKKKVTNQEYVDRLNKYKTQMALVAGAINQAAGAGVLNGGEYARLAMESFPNEYTSEAVARAWFDNAREVLNSLPEDRATELADYLNQ